MTTMQRTGPVLACVLLAVMLGVSLRAAHDGRTAQSPVVTFRQDDPLPEPQAITRECVAHARLNLAKLYGAEGPANRLLSVTPVTAQIWKVRGELTSLKTGRVTRYPYECLNGPGGLGVKIHPRLPQQQRRGEAVTGQPPPLPVVPAPYVPLPPQDAGFVRAQDRAARGLVA
ncbi:hypothetical protein [Deinococcus radiotolerans]|uniref:Uncharacterized protein n=1 Tax=Deinococcus radiotolerans TaxID=1309407 RepID=A0ABQ2FFM8_9DEIO|nr:hypothetical protein [Deinococcus radiotolerans]GGK93764.1 hypothetical protein GCM10010844_10330 [Deinococcus radiotolerans]